MCRQDLQELVQKVTGQLRGQEEESERLRKDLLEQQEQLAQAKLQAAQSITQQKEDMLQEYQN